MDGGTPPIGAADLPAVSAAGPARSARAVGLIVSADGRSVRLLRDGGQWDLFDFFMAAVALLAVVWLLSEMKAHLTERRSLTIDGEGVTVDGERLLWAEIDRVELNEDDEVVLHAAPTSGRHEIRVSDSHVSDPRLVGRLLELEFRARRGYTRGLTDSSRVSAGLYVEGADIQRSEEKVILDAEHGVRGGQAALGAVPVGHGRPRCRTTGQRVLG